MAQDAPVVPENVMNGLLANPPSTPTTAQQPQSSVVNVSAIAQDAQIDFSRARSAAAAPLPIVETPPRPQRQRKRQRQAESGSDAASNDNFPIPGPSTRQARLNAHLQNAVVEAYQDIQEFAHENAPIVPVVEEAEDSEEPPMANEFDQFDLDVNARREMALETLGIEAGNARLHSAMNEAGHQPGHHEPQSAPAESYADPFAIPQDGSFNDEARHQIELQTLWEQAESARLRKERIMIDSFHRLATLERELKHTAWNTTNQYMRREFQRVMDTTREAINQLQTLLLDPQTPSPLIDNPAFQRRRGQLQGVVHRVNRAVDAAVAAHKQGITVSPVQNFENAMREAEKLVDEQARSHAGCKVAELWRSPAWTGGLKETEEAVAVLDGYIENNSPIFAHQFVRHLSELEPSKVDAIQSLLSAEVEISTKVYRNAKTLFWAQAWKEHGCWSEGMCIGDWQRISDAIKAKLPRDGFGLEGGQLWIWVESHGDEQLNILESGWLEEYAEEGGDWVGEDEDVDEDMGEMMEEVVEVEEVVEEVIEEIVELVED